MILSRTLARARIARGERPGRLAAWGPVVADLVASLVLFGGIAMLLITLAEVDRIGNATAIGGLIALCYLPSQGLLILSALWAAKSRWAGPDTDEETGG